MSECSGHGSVAAQSGVIHLDKEKNLVLCTYFKAKISRKGRILDAKLSPRGFFLVWCLHGLQENAGAHIWQSL